MIQLSSQDVAFLVSGIMLSILAAIVLAILEDKRKPAQETSIYEGTGHD